MSADLIERLRKWSDPAEFERIMRNWDTWRKYIKEGGGGSWPRDAFESLLDAFGQDASEAADTLAANVKELAEIAGKIEQTRVELGETQLVLATTERNCEAEIAEIRAENERLQDEEDKSAREMQAIIQGLRDRAIAAESELARIRSGLTDIELDIHLASGIAGYDLKPALAKIRSLGLLDGEVGG